MCSIACQRSAPLLYALILLMHKSTASEPFIIQPHVVACSIACRMRASAARACAQRYCTCAARCVGTRFKHASRVLGHILPEQNGSGWSTGVRDARARPGALGGAGRRTLGSGPRYQILSHVTRIIYLGPLPTGH